MKIGKEDVLRFQSKYHKKGPNDCWLWKTPVPKGKENRYPGFWLDGKARTASRVSLIIHSEEERPLDVLHTCDNPRCVNPGHLFWGTHQDNMIDMKKKGRFTPSRGNTRLAVADVFEIRRLYDTGRWTLKQLAFLFNCHYTNIQLIVTRKKWTHI